MYKTPPKSCMETPSRSESDLPKLCVEEGSLLDISPINITQRAKRRRQTNDGSHLGSFADQFLDLKNELKSELKELINDLMRSQNSRMDTFEKHILEMKSHCTTIEETNKQIEKSMTAISSELTLLERKIANIELDRNNMAKRLIYIEEKLDNIDRSCIQTCIEIRNVPKRPKETKNSLFTLVQHLSKALDTNTQLSDIRDVSRLPSKKENKTSNISIEFTNTLHKSNFLLAAKQFNIKNSTNKINSTHLGIEGPGGPIYIAEQLTTLSKKLFYAARNFAKQNGYAYCWTSNGRVMLKKNADSQYILVKNEQQLLQMSQPSNEQQPLQTSQPNDA